jgi:dolichol-phosphate mannosyltransferase
MGTMPDAMPHPNLSPDPSPLLSIVLPVYNEALSIGPVLEELLAILPLLAPASCEIIAVNDGSSDDTPSLLHQYAQNHPVLRIVHLPKNAGQSAAFFAGFHAARGAVIATMDADGQNDPADFPRLLAELQRTAADCVCGFRANRRDTRSRRWAGRLANAIRRRVLNDGIIDSGCAVKVFRASLVARLTPWNGAHRFFPALFLMQGATIQQCPVNHRPRHAGRSKYTNAGRLLRTVRDLLGVAWLTSRALRIPPSD